MRVTSFALLTFTALFAQKALAERPSYRHLETKLTSYSNSTYGESVWSGSLDGSLDFGGRFFVSSSLGFGNTGEVGERAALALGVMKNVGKQTSVFASIGGQRYSDVQIIRASSAVAGLRTLKEYSSATLTLGMKSRLTEQFEVEGGITGLASGPSSAQVGLKGTYYLTDSLGAVIEFGASDGDGSGGIGVRFSF